MWLLEGRFAEDSRQELSKLLKYGQTYTLGRKIPADIVIDSKFVSRVSCHITVASEDTISSQVNSVTDPLSFHNDVRLRPRVNIRFEANKSRKTFGVTQLSRRSGSTDPTEVQVPADQEHVLEDGDFFALTTTISLRLVWKPMAICFAAKIKENAIAPFRQAVLKLGIHLSPAKSRWRDGYTHLCLIQVKPTESVLCALLQARPIVTIDYFTELFRRADLPRHDPNSLETSFTEPDLTTYQPSIDQQELSEIPDMHEKLLPEERRTHMLKGTTCVFFALPAEEGELSIYKSVLSVAGAHVFTHNPQAEGLKTKADFAQLLMPYKNSALSYWRNSGSKARSEAPDEGLVVLVGAVHDEEGWKEGCKVACRNLRIAMPSGFHAITNAVFAADVRAHLNTIPTVSDGEGDGEVEGAAPAAQEEVAADVTAVERVERSPTRPAIPAERAAMAPPATAAPVQVQPPAATAEPPSTATEQQRRPLTRRTRKPAHQAEEPLTRGTPQANASANVTMDTTASASRSVEAGIEALSQLTREERSGLTRRTGASRVIHRRSDVFDAILRSDAGQSMDLADASASLSTDAGAGSSIPKSRRFRMDLDEEDRAQTQVSDASQAQQSADSGKRKSPPQPQPPTDHAARGNERSSKCPRTSAPSPATEPAPESTQSAVELPRVIRTDPSLDHTGLGKGAQPDTQPKFLQALNTQRAEGKKMDEFDADFNRLQIAKPSSSTQASLNLARGIQQKTAGGGGVDEDYEAFKAMTEEELKIHVRGNFVQVDFVPLIRQKVQRDVSGNGAGGNRGDVPNFKKFRGKGATGERGRGSGSGRRGLEMVLPESNDYGLGQSYWEDEGGSLATSRGERKGSRLALSDEETPSARPPKSKIRVALDPGPGEDSAIHLDLDSMESDEDAADMTTLMRRQHGSRSQPAAGGAGRGRKRPIAALAAESDEGMPPPTSTSRRKATPATKGRVTTTIIDDEDDDSDDGGGDGGGDDGNFAGFGRSTSTRRRRVDPSSSARTRRFVF
ncbi:hypothetical protein NDA13_001555 [Ustilago tritici]|nr:hypothetical protein NDA13_001555 [Ustilago tritici]